MHKIGLILALGGLSAGGALAAEPDEPHVCAGIADAGERLACYDRAFGEPGSATESGISAAPAERSPASVPSASAPLAVASPVAAAAAGADAEGAARGEEEFGFTEAELRARDAERGRDKRPESIEAVITAIDYLRTRERVITLDNGQVWREMEVVTRARLAVGDTVTIKDAALSSYLMVGPSARAVRVRRVK